MVLLVAGVAAQDEKATLLSIPQVRRAPMHPCKAGGKAGCRPHIQPVKSGVRSGVHGSVLFLNPTGTKRKDKSLAPCRVASAAGASASASQWRF